MRLRFLAAAGLLASSLAAHADESYTLDVGTYYGKVSFSEPQLLVTDTIVQQADFLSYDGSSEPISIEIDPLRRYVMASQALLERSRASPTF